MVRALKYLAVLAICFVSYTCKKKTSIDVNVLNYRLDEPVANAKVVLIERELSTFGNTYSCNEIASARTDANGNCNFDKEKLKDRSKFEYFLVVAEAYGKAQTYPCGGKTSGFLKVGDNQKQKLDVGGIKTVFKVQYNNLLNPSQPNDSLIVSLTTIAFTQANGSPFLGGGGVFGGFQYYLPLNPPPSYPSIYTTEVITTEAQRLKRYIRKRKLGVMSVKIDTIKVLPNQTNIVEIDW